MYKYAPVTIQTLIGPELMAIKCLGYKIANMWRAYRAAGNETARKQRAYNEAMDNEMASGMVDLFHNYR